jgi:hypothetical protein
LIHNVQSFAQERCTYTPAAKFCKDGEFVHISIFPPLHGVKAGFIKPIEGGLASGEIGFGGPVVWGVGVYWGGVEIPACDADDGVAREEDGFV